MMFLPIWTIISGIILIMANRTILTRCNVPPLVLPIAILPALIGLIGVIIGLVYIVKRFTGLHRR